MAKKAAPKATEKSSTSNRAVTKGEIFAAIGEKTGLSKKQVASVFDGLSELIGKELGKKGPGQFVVPGLLKLKVVRKPATKEKPGINPFTKQPMTITAKPARNVVRALPLKALKELV
ncbi:MAG: HU family DNA-binding protein [Isosphaeraceae bacterium]|nr:HU family DNA-binding protein [Isosphaeraceae bacterium]